MNDCVFVAAMFVMGGLIGWVLAWLADGNEEAR